MRTALQIAMMASGIACAAIGTATTHFNEGEVLVMVSGLVTALFGAALAVYAVRQMTPETGS